MVFVLLLGLTTLAAASRHALSASPSHGNLARSFTTATLFSIAAGVSGNIASVCAKVPANPEWANSPDMPLIVLVGIGEALSPAIVGFALLSSAALLSAVGAHRAAGA